MKLDRFFTDIRKTIERILLAFDHNITVQENLGPSGAPEGHVIVSRGPALTPVWGPAVVVGDEDDDEETEAPVGEVGPQGPPGPPGPPGDPLDFDMIVTADFGDGFGEQVVVSGGNVVTAEFD
jgi:hypothetical protein